MTIKTRFPSIEPSLDLNFAATKRLDPRITFTRASSATFVNEDGLIEAAGVNQARFDHTPTTGESLGLLVEEARTNLWQWSNSATDGQTWNNVGTHLTLTAGQTSPTGDSTAIRAADVDNATAGTFLQRTLVAPALTANTFVSYSIFIKPINIPNTIGVAIFANGTTDGVTGTFTVSGSAITGSSINYNGTGASGSASHVAYPNGWYRLTVSGIPSTILMTDCRVRINLGSYTRSTGTARFDWYGGQFENNAFASSYFPNAGTLGGATRAADVASITGTNFSSWYNQTEGTMFADYKVASSSGNLIGSSDGTNNNRIFLGIASGPLARLLITTSGSAVASIGVAYALNSASKTAGVYSTNYFQSATAGVLGTEDVLGGVPTVDRLAIGTNTTQSDFFANGTIKRLTYWPTRLSNPTLQQITQ